MSEKEDIVRELTKVIGSGPGGRDRGVETRLQLLAHDLACGAARGALVNRCVALGGLHYNLC
jgi:hypothetical protein